MKYRLNHAAVRRIARNEWNVRERIIIERRKWRGQYRLNSDTDPGSTYYGWCSWYAEDHAHRIVIRSTLEPVQFLQTLAHELEHCRQAEYHGPGFNELYVENRDRFERQAQRAERKWWKLGPALR